MTALGYATSGRTYKDNVAEMQTDIQVRRFFSCSL